MLNHPKRAALFIAGFLTGLGSASAAGIGNLPYKPNEMMRPISLFNTRTNMPNGPGGADTVMLLHGYLVVLGTYDSGKGGAALHVYDLSNPRSPLLVKTYTSPLTSQMAEWHMAGMAKVDGKDIVCVRTTGGIAFLDLTDPTNPKDVSKLDLPGVRGGDYTNTSWMNSWSWPYVYTATSGAGISVSDAANPAAPRFIKQIPIGRTGNFRVGPITVAGNYLLVTNMDQSPFRASVLDLSDPVAPTLIDTLSASDGVYSATIIGDLLFGAGENGRYTFVRWAPGGTSVVASKTFGSDKGGYCTYQDGFAFCGQSKDGFRQLDLRDLTNIRDVGHAALSESDAPNGDFDFATVLGNLVFQGNDHGTGNGLFVHQAAPDTSPPAVVKIYPEADAARVSVSTRITVFFSDELDMDSVGERSLIVREEGGSPVSGVYSHSSTNAISFGPRRPLEPNRRYEIAVVAGGVRDVVGNPIREAVTSRFTTGAPVAVRVGAIAVNATQHLADQPIPPAPGPRGGCACALPVEGTPPAVAAMTFGLLVACAGRVRRRARRR